MARKLKNFYKAQHPTPEVESWGRIAKLKISTDENFDQTKQFVGATLSHILWKTLSWFTKESYRRRRALFESRIRNRWIRDCHGDLHLEHIHLTGEALHIYDCIEFNDRFRYVDVANDVAFLAMDLDHQQRPDLSRYFVLRMASALGDSGMLEIMDFYKCYRAYVRGKVESLQSQANGAPERDRKRHAARAARYFQQALRYAVAGSRPMVLVVMGRVASGKSTLARALGEELGWKVFSSDALRKELGGVPLKQRTPRAARAKLYSARQTRRTYEKLMSLARAEIKAGRNVILDATFSRRVQRARLLRRFADNDQKVRFLETHAPGPLTRQRLKQRDRSARAVSDARLEDYAQLNARYESPNELPSTQRIVVDTAGDLPGALDDALRRLVQAESF